MLEYPVHFASAPVGIACIEKDGLYYRLNCRCYIPEKGIYTLWIHGSRKKEKAGIFLRQEGEYILHTSIPVKRMPEGKLDFRVVPKATTEVLFVEILAEKPFTHLANLKTARFCAQEGRRGVIIPVSLSYPSQANDQDP